jgi:hypothetical protein
MVEHIKLIARDTSLGPFIFGDFYRSGIRGEESPLIIYVGGAISKDEYQLRISSEPTPVVNEFFAAVRSGSSCIDLLVLPFPPEPDGTVHQELFSILLFDLLRQTPNPRPSRIACLGYSIGASFATYLTFSLPQVRALSVIGGYGMSEGANESRMVGNVKSRKYRAFWNADSSGYMENLFFLHLLTKYDAEMEIVTASGGHDFADYATNGSVRDAFEFVIECLNDNS